MWKVRSHYGSRAPCYCAGRVAARQSSLFASPVARMPWVDLGQERYNEPGRLVLLPERRPLHPVRQEIAMLRTHCLRLVALAVCLTVTTPGFAQMARMVGTVVDEQGGPIEGVTITVTCGDKPQFREVVRTRKNGQFSLNFRDPFLVYTFVVGKEGYQSLEQDIQGTASEIMRPRFVLETARETQQPAAATLPQAPAGAANEAVEAYNAGVIALQAGDLQTARRQLEAALAADEQLAPARSALAGIYLDQRQFQEALDMAASALALTPGDVNALEVTHEAYLALGEREKAEQASQELATLEDQVSTATRSYNEGGAAYQAGDLDTALAKFQEAARLNPSLYDAHHAVASLLAKRGDFTGAAAAAEAALALKPGEPRTLRIAYESYRGLDQPERAQKALVALAAADPEMGAQGLLEQGNEAFQAGDTAQAQLLLASAVEINPELPKAHYLLGLCYINTGRSSEAKAHLEKFIALAPDDPDVAAAREMLGFIQ
jgi:tetratricopeptide (TPR) repeat protein